MLTRTPTLGACLTAGRDSGTRKGLLGSGLAHPGLPKMLWALHSVWPLSTDLVLFQVKIYGAGRSRILQALARRPETLASHGPEKGEKQLPALQPLAGTQGPQRLCYLGPQLGPLSPPGPRPGSPVTGCQGSVCHRGQEPMQTTKAEWCQQGLKTHTSPSSQALIYTAMKEHPRVFKINNFPTLEQILAHGHTLPLE